MSLARHGSADDVADAVSAGSSTKETISFDNLVLYKSGSESMPENYGGLSWTDDFYVAEPSVFLKGEGLSKSGYFNGITSGKQIAYNNGANPVGVYVTGHMNFQSVELTAAGDKKLVVDIYAFKGSGPSVAHDRVTITDGKPTLVKLDWNNITEVDFYSRNGTADKGFGKIGPVIVFDDMKVSNILNGKFGATPHLGQTHGVSAQGAVGHAVELHATATAHLETLHIIHPIA